MSIEGLWNWIADSAAPNPWGCAISYQGRLLGEYYGGGAHAGARWDIGSIRKSFTSALAGQLIDAGIVSLDTLGHEKWPQLVQLSGREEDRQITLHHLLGSTSGWLTDDPPGKRFRYNNAAFTAAERVIAGALNREPAPEVLDRFAKPLGLNDLVSYHRASPFDPASCNDPGPKLVIECTVQDLVKWGKLWAAGGQSDGRQLIPAWYVERATSRVDPELTESHYGYCWFVNAEKALWPAVPPESFGHPGHGYYPIGPLVSRSFLWVAPSLGLVAAICADVSSGIAEDYRDVPMATTAQWISRVLVAVA
jgi:CubicO group peptidase (beta-lactamase class C family)